MKPPLPTAPYYSTAGAGAEWILVDQDGAFPSREPPAAYPNFQRRPFVFQVNANNIRISSGVDIDSPHVQKVHRDSVLDAGRHLPPGPGWNGRGSRWERNRWPAESTVATRWDRAMALKEIDMSDPYDPPAFRSTRDEARLQEEEHVRRMRELYPSLRPDFPMMHST